MKSILEILECAKNVIADPAHWVAGLRYDGYGRYCALGAVDKCVERFADENRQAVKVLAIAADELFPSDLGYDGYNWTNSEGYNTFGPGSRVAAVNNILGHKAAMVMFDRAIELAAENVDAEQPV